MTRPGAGGVGPLLSQDPGQGEVAGAAGVALTPWRGRRRGRMTVRDEQTYPGAGMHRERRVSVLLWGLAWSAHAAPLRSGPFPARAVPLLTAALQSAGGCLADGPAVALLPTPGEATCRQGPGSRVC